MRTQLKAALLAATTVLALGPAATALPAAATTGTTATARQAPVCGHFTNAGTEYYRNCANVSERIWVTRRFSQNEHYCVQPGTQVQLGNFANVYGVYHDGWNC
ncbi:DUF6355 family natural product biosynthesis protein [Nonomuraea sp. NPDC059023]|uniref:DUF6355 family natural product biosynthesis protein n=1 Tax=unclassified Nonomuraea TaxID=2593643 RepID=UPI003686D37C